MGLEQKFQNIKKEIREFLSGCIDPSNARLYGNFKERTALNITQFPKIQGSLLIRMGFVYPIVSHLVEKIGIPKEAHSDILGIGINYHTWIAGYLAYVVEIQAGLSKYPIEGMQKIGKSIKSYLAKKVD